MSDMKAVFKAIAVAVQQQIAQEYPPDKAPSILVLMPEITAKVQTEIPPKNQDSSQKSVLNNL